MWRVKLKERIQVRITREMSTELSRLATERRLRGGKESDIVRDAIAEYIERRNGKAVGKESQGRKNAGANGN